MGDKNGENVKASEKLVECCKNDDWDAVWDCLKQGANPDGLSGQRSSPLEMAARADRLAVVEKLLASGADANLRSQQEFTPMMGAIVGGSSRCLAALLKAGADAGALAEYGVSALHLLSSARRNGDGARKMADALGEVVCVDLLEKRDAGACTPLLVAVVNGAAEAMEALIDLGADIDARDVSGEGIEELLYSNEGGIRHDENRRCEAAISRARARQEAEALAAVCGKGAIGARARL